MNLLNGRLDKLFGILMEVHSVHKFGKATKAAQPLEIGQAVPAESTDQAWACTKRAGLQPLLKHS